MRARVVLAIAVVQQTGRRWMHTPGERNYHVFYQLVAAAKASPELAQQCLIKDVESYAYLNQVRYLIKCLTTTSITSWWPLPAPMFVSFGSSTRARSAGIVSV